MLNLCRLALVSLGWCIVVAAGAQEPAKPKLSDAIKVVLDQPRYKTAHWGLYVVDAKTGDVFLDHQSEKLFAPASCTKLYSVAAAFEQWGPDHRFHTKLVHTGALNEEKKLLKGDLILRASGDLTMGGRTLPDGSIAFKDNDHTYANGSTRGQLTEVDPLAGLNEIARKVAEKIKHIDGDVLIDDRLFDHAESTGSGPAHLTPVLINDNLIDFTITPDTREGQPARVEHRPAGSAIQVDAQVETIAEKEVVAEGDSSVARPRINRASISITAPVPGRYVVRGVIPVSHKPLLRVREVDDPASHARSLLIDALHRAGVKVKASPLGVSLQDKLPASSAMEMLPAVTELISPPFSENARLILKVSHNLHASTLPLLLAAHHQQRTLSQGLRQQAGALKRLGVPLETISFGGGAGGSRSDYTTPRATVTLLQSISKRPEYQAYRRALPIVGVDGTTAASVPANSPARGKFQAKTGTLSWNNGLSDNSIMTSKALAGYGETATGRQVIFAFFVNNAFIGEDGAIQAGRDLGQLCELLYQSE